MAACPAGTWSGICAHVVPAMYMVAILSGPTMAGTPWSSSMPAAIDACTVSGNVAISCHPEVSTAMSVGDFYEEVLLLAFLHKYIPVV